MTTVNDLGIGFARVIETPRAFDRRSFFDKAHCKGAHSIDTAFASSDHVFATDCR